MATAGMITDVYNADEAPKAFDIDDFQLVMVMEGTPQRFWHHVALCRIRDSLWATLDPDGDVVIDNIAEERVPPLHRGQEVPAERTPVLMIEEIPQVDLARFRARA